MGVGVGGGVEWKREGEEIHQRGEYNEVEIHTSCGQELGVESEEVKGKGGGKREGEGARWSDPKRRRGVGKCVDDSRSGQGRDLLDQCRG